MRVRSVPARKDLAGWLSEHDETTLQGLKHISEYFGVFKEIDIKIKDTKQNDELRQLLTDKANKRAKEKFNKMRAL